jgi:hypothetical protein
LNFNDRQTAVLGQDLDEQAVMLRVAMLDQQEGHFDSPWEDFQKFRNRLKSSGGRATIGKNASASRASDLLPP